jgi:hypothetical protein
MASLCLSDNETVQDDSHGLMSEKRMSYSEHSSTTIEEIVHELHYPLNTVSANAFDTEDQ